MVARRRAKKSAQQWSEIIEEFEFSGLSESEFCENLDLSPATFRKWRYRMSKPISESSRSTSGSFAPVAINQSDSQCCAQAVIDLGAEVRIECDSLSISAIAQLALAVRHGR